MSVIVITGGSRGIGASAAVHCARRGMGVILTYKSNVQAADSVVQRI
ncbi:MAG: SDR family NAD(P)-dependent oxidoreductase, partial [Pseudomonas mandelii]